MIKFFLILLLVVNTYAFDVQIASKIFDKLFVALIQKNDSNILVYTKDKEYYAVIDAAEHLELITNSDQSDIILVNKEENLPKSSVALFTTNTKLFLKNENVLCVFFWKHGRPKIIFSQERLENFNITLDKKWSKYIKSNSDLGSIL